LEKQTLHRRSLEAEKRHQAIKGLRIWMKSCRSLLLDQTRPPLSLQSTLTTGFG
jgi:hypothetical protein